jgi:hypothetical protein
LANARNRLEENLPLNKRNVAWWSGPPGWVQGDGEEETKQPDFVSWDEAVQNVLDAFSGTEEVAS